MAINVIDFTGNESRETCIAKKLSKDFYSNGKGEMIALVFGSEVRVIFWENGDERLFDELKEKGTEEINQMLAGSKKTFDYSKGSYEKVFIKPLFNEKFLKIWIDEVGTYVLFFEEVEDKLELRFLEEKDFDEESFLQLAENRRNARIAAEKKAEEDRILAEKNAKEAARKEKASKVIIPTTISKIGESKVLVGHKVSVKPHFGNDEPRTETFRPFESLKGGKLNIADVTGKNSVHKRPPRGSRQDFSRPTKGENIGLEQEFRQNMEGVGQNSKSSAEPVAVIA